MKRKEGYYWINYKWDNGLIEWIVCDYRKDFDGYFYYCCGMEQSLKKENILEIDETPITRKTNEPTTKGTDTTIS